MHSQARAFRDAIAGNRPVLGTFLVEFSAPSVADIFAAAGFDFLLIDMEHGNFTPREVEGMIRHATSAGLCAFVRTPDTQRNPITRVLDAGAAGVVIPAVRSMEQVRQAVETTKYRPLGRRGVHLLRGHTQHRPTDPATFLMEANRDVLTILQIELTEAVGLADEIAATAGVDGLYVGPGDLSVDLGVPGQWNSPPVQKAIGVVAKACRAHGKIFGCHADDVDTMPNLRRLGVQMFGLFCDIGLLSSAAGFQAARFREILS
jgi:4-hydroxy-2-oxoheptanedioate aldolase